MAQRSLLERIDAAAETLTRLLEQLPENAPRSIAISQVEEARKLAPQSESLRPQPANEPHGH